MDKTLLGEIGANPCGKDGIKVERSFYRAEVNLLGLVGIRGLKERVIGSKEIV